MRWLAFVPLLGCRSEGTTRWAEDEEGTAPRAGACGNREVVGYRGELSGSSFRSSAGAMVWGGMGGWAAARLIRCGDEGRFAGSVDWGGDHDGTANDEGRFEGTFTSATGAGSVEFGLTWLTEVGTVDLQIHEDHLFIEFYGEDQANWGNSVGPLYPLDPPEDVGT
jgi:hypothetical protein